MKRSGFAVKRYIPAASAPARKSTRRGIMARVDGSVRAHPKQHVFVSQVYRSLVRLLPCAHCGQPPPSEFCHSDEGKGMGIKTDDRRGWPGCAPHASEMGCHHLIGMTGTYPKAQRRQLENAYAAWARSQIMEAGEWPATLPLWQERLPNDGNTPDT